MTPKQFILNNSEKFRQAVENGYDIRMDEQEIFKWMERYRSANFETESPRFFTEITISPDCILGFTMVDADQFAQKK